MEVCNNINCGDLVIAKFGVLEFTDIGAMDGFQDNLTEISVRIVVLANNVDALFLAEVDLIDLNKCGIDGICGVGVWTNRGE